MGYGIPRGKAHINRYYEGFELIISSVFFPTLGNWQYSGTTKIGSALLMLKFVWKPAQRIGTTHLQIAFLVFWSYWIHPWRVTSIQSPPIWMLDITVLTVSSCESASQPQASSDADAWGRSRGCFQEGAGGGETWRVGTRLERLCCKPKQTELA